ncbi:MAG: GNAT family N-acetyltransferase [Defluviitaleaceae bacterium]|nr:GNAT family N-acetyltransferase [Defluviitaleaceae bacterium]
MILTYVEGYEIRILNPDDYDVVAKVYETNKNYLDTYEKDISPQKYFLTTWERLVDGYDAVWQLFFALCKDGFTVAVVEILPHFPNQGVLWFSEIIIHGDVKGCGLGSKIVKAVIEAVRKDGGHNQIKLGIAKENPDAKIFWQKMGFIIEQEYDDMIGLYCI